MSLLASRLRGATVTVVTILAALLVAAPVVSAQASSPAPRPTVAAAPRIASYNVFMLSRNLYPNWGQVKRADLIDQQNVLAGQDVVVLNELFDNAAGDRLKANLADTYPYQTPVVGRSTSGWDATGGSYSATAPEDGGVSVVSRWPITRKVQHVYADACGVEVFSNKGFAYVRLSSPQGPVHVIGTHAQAEDPSCTVSPASVRASQFAEIADFLAAEGVPASEPLYIAGDLNVIRDSAEYPAMLNALGVQAPSFVGHPFSWDCNDNSVCQGQYGDGYASEHLDYVLPVIGHPAPATWRNETRRAKSPSWSVTSWFTTYTYNDFSDHYPVFGYAG